MSTFKKFTSNDIIVTPFTVNKSFSYSGDVPGANDDGPVRLVGQNSSYPLSGEEIGTASAELIYHSIKQLYYTNFLSGSDGKISNASTASFNPDGTISGPFYTTNYDNYIQSNDELRYAATTQDIFITALSIPSKQFGEYIKPGSYSDDSYYDDGQGNLIQTSNGNHVGNIIYKDGIIVYSGVNGGGGAVFWQNPQWESTITMYETQYKCTIRSNELNYSLNPSLLKTYGNNDIINSGSATYKDFVTGSDFSPYITSIGLYDDQQNLLAVAKLAQPLKTSQTTDTTILINIDR